MVFADNLLNWGKNVRSAYPTWLFRDSTGVESGTLAKLRSRGGAVDKIGHGSGRTRVGAEPWVGNEECKKSGLWWN